MLAFTTKAWSHTIIMRDSKLQRLVSEVHKVDSLAFSQLCDLQRSHTNWFDDPPAHWSSGYSEDKVDYVPELSLDMIKTEEVCAWSANKVLDWCEQNGKHYRKKMVIFLSLNRRFTIAVKALSTYCDSNEAHNQLLLENSMRLKRYRATRKTLWQMMKSSDLREKVVAEKHGSKVEFSDLMKISAGKSSKTSIESGTNGISTAWT